MYSTIPGQTKEDMHELATRTRKRQEAREGRGEGQAPIYESPRETRISKRKWGNWGQKPIKRKPRGQKLRFWEKPDSRRSFKRRETNPQSLRCSVPPRPSKLEEA